MKVLNVNDADLRGRRFNGLDLLDDFAGHGVEALLAVLRKAGDDPRVEALLEGPLDEAIDDALWRMEYDRSLSGVLSPWARALVKTKSFTEADVVHYHLIHNGVISLLDLPWLTRLKPSVWTFHDMWPLTGHCVQPLDCAGWRDGCRPCPYPDRWFALREDRAGDLWDLKEQVYGEMDVDVVVASEHLAQFVADSPLAAHLPRVHLIPFGVRTEIFLDDEAREDSRQGLGIAPNEFVIALRAAEGRIKGTPGLVDALLLEPPARPTTLLAFDGVGLLGALKRDYKVIELGWVKGAEELARAFSACDVFAMPSEAESFGLMAVEAMAAGRPVLCIQGTAVETVTRAPECGIAVPQRDPRELRRALDELANDPVDARRRGEAGRMIVEEAYGHERFLSALQSVYRSAIDRFRAQHR